VTLIKLYSDLFLTSICGKVINLLVFAEKKGAPSSATEQFSSMDSKKDEEKKAAEKVSQTASDSVKVPEPAVTQTTAPTEVKR
jgi:hypothetical protein